MNILSVFSRLGLTLTLCAPRVLAAPSPLQSGQVVDERGRPLAGAFVVRVESSSGEAWSGEWSGKIAATFRTDAKGTFALNSTQPKAPTWFVAWTKGRAVASMFGGNATPARLILRPVKAIRLRLVDNAGRGVVGARLSFFSRSPQLNRTQEGGFLPRIQTPWPFPTEISSDARGFAWVPFGAPGDLLALKVESPGFQTIHLRQQVPIDEGLTVRLVPDARLKGRLLDGASNRPLANAKVALLGYGEAQTDELGRFSLVGLDETRSFLMLGRGDLVLPARAQSTKRGQTLNVGDLRASRGSVVRGRVLDSQRKPVADASVWATLQGGEYSAMGRPLAAVQSGQDGRFELRLPPGRFSLGSWARSQGQPAERTIETVEGKRLDIELVFGARNTPHRQAIAPKPQTERVEYLSGQVVDETGQPVAGASVAYSGNGQILGTATSNAQGLWVTGALRVVGPDLPRSFQLVASAPGLLGIPQNVTPTREAPVVLRLGKGRDLSVRLQDKDGQPVAGVEVQATRISFASATAWQGVEDIPAFPLLRTPTVTDENGVAVLPNLPQDGFVGFKTSAKDGFAGGVFTCALPRKATANFRLARATTISGSVRLGKAGPTFVVPGLRVKGQTWSGPWSDYQQWRMDSIAPDGTFNIGNVPSLEMLGEPTYSLNLDLPGLGYGESREVSPGIRVAYVNGWNMMLTLQRGGKTERWISWMEAQGRGLKWSEGQQLKHDMVLQPLALLRGQLPPHLLKRGRRTISYRPPLSVYGEWRIEADSKGHFEIPVPVGEKVTVRFPDGPREFSGLKAHEEKTVDFKSKPAPAPASARRFAGNGAMRELMLRVVGPDGVTVPRPRLKWKGGPTFTGRDGFAPGEMDGTVSVWNSGRTSEIEISSPELLRPLKILFSPGQRIQTVRLARLPPRVEGDPFALRAQVRRATTTPAPRTSAAAPQIVPVGELAPELQVERWLSGKPLSLRSLRGRVVVILGDGAPETLSGLRGLNVTRIRLVPDSSLNRAEDPGVAVALDSRVDNGWRGFNARRLGLGGWNDAALIGPDGRLISTKLSGPFLRAKIEQLLETAPSP